MVIYSVGTILRYGPGSTALMQVVSHTHLHSDNVRYYGEHHFGGIVQAHSNTVTEATAEDIAVWDTESVRRAKRHLEVFNLTEFLRKKNIWSVQTFGRSNGIEGVLRHIESEITEVRANPTDVTEWIDIILLAFDGAFRSGYTAEQVVSALIQKQAKNVRRQWPDWRTKKEGEFSSHIKGIED
jgi:hypothetical protein